MEIANWLRAIEKQGGWPCVVEFIFDNSCFYYLRPDIPREEQVEWDEETDTWIFYRNEEPYTINGKKVPRKVIEANEGLQRIHMVVNAEDQARFRRDI